MMMLVRIGDPKDDNRLLSLIGFLAITLVPWGVLIWLLWSRR